MIKEKNWENFIKENVYEFMQQHDLQKITVDNGAKTGSILIDTKGNVKVKITLNKTI